MGIQKKKPKPKCIMYYFILSGYCICKKWHNTKALYGTPGLSYHGKITSFYDYIFLLLIYTIIWCAFIKYGVILALFEDQK